MINSAGWSGNGGKGVKIGDRVKFKTLGGWYNSGILKDVDENELTNEEKTCLVEVDKLGCGSDSEYQMPLPYFARLLYKYIEIESDKVESEE